MYFSYFYKRVHLKHHNKDDYSVKVRVKTITHKQTLCYETYYTNFHDFTICPLCSLPRICKKGFKKQHANDGVSRSFFYRCLDRLLFFIFKINRKEKNKLLNTLKLITILKSPQNSV